MYFKRKIDKWLIEWKNKSNKSPALIVGIRQCGKTESILEFSKNYKKVIKINFVICYKGCSYLVEAKAKTGNTKASKTVMANKDHYGPTKLIKIGDYNIGETGDILTISH